MTERRSSGTRYHLVQRLPWPKGKPFKILSLDGGGIRGLFPAQLLTEVEAELAKGANLCSYFDMVAGTSTGGILGLGLAAGLRSRHLLDKYLKDGNKIFARAKNPLLHPRKTMHDRKPLEDLVQKTLGERTFGESLTRMVIPGVDQFPEPVMRKTAHHPDYKSDYARKAAKIALETSAAPLYLGGFEDNESVYLDGGLFINNPIMAAVVDALACYEIERGQIRVLSIGCGHVDKKILAKEASKGSAWWATNAMDISSRLQSHNSLGQAGLLIGRQNIVRIDPELSSDIAMDDYLSSKERLIPLALDKFSEFRSELAPFFIDPVIPYERFHG